MSSDDLTPGLKLLTGEQYCNYSLLASTTSILSPSRKHLSMQTSKEFRDDTESTLIHMKKKLTNFRTSVIITNK